MRLDERSWKENGSEFMITHKHKTHTIEANANESNCKFNPATLNGKVGERRCARACSDLRWSNRSSHTQGWVRDQNGYDASGQHSAHCAMSRRSFVVTRIRHKTSCIIEATRTHVDTELKAKIARIVKASFRPHIIVWRGQKTSPQQIETAL